MPYTASPLSCDTFFVKEQAKVKSTGSGKGDDTMSNADVPIWEKYTLTIDEAAKYFRIGENKLRKLAEENPAAGWVIMNGNRIQIKRKQFEKMIDTIDTI